MNEEILRAFAAEYRSKHLVPALGRGRVCTQLANDLDSLVNAYLDRHALRAPDITERAEGDIIIKQGSFHIAEYDSGNLKQRAVLVHLMNRLEQYVTLDDVAKAVQSRTQPTAMVLRGLETQVNRYSTEFSLKANTNHKYRLSKATGRVINEKYGVRVCEHEYSIGNYDCADETKRLALLQLLNAAKSSVMTSDLARICGRSKEDVRVVIAHLSEELSQHIRGWSINTDSKSHWLRSI